MNRGRQNSTSNISAHHEAHSHCKHIVVFPADIRWHDGAIAEVPGCSSNRDLCHGLLFFHFNCHSQAAYRQEENAEAGVAARYVVDQNRDTVDQYHVTSEPCVTQRRTVCVLYFSITGIDQAYRALREHSLQPQQLH
jgi:hypothetical protein